MNSLARTLRALTRGKAFRPARQLLPLDTWFASGDPPFRFGLPFPWEEVAPSELEEATLLGVWAPRTIGMCPSISFSFQPDGTDVTAADLRVLINGLTQSFGGQCVGVRSVLVDQARAVIPVILGQDGLVVQLLLVNYLGGRVEGLLQLPGHCSSAYLPHFETLLATWTFRA